MKLLLKENLLLICVSVVCVFILTIAFSVDQNGQYDQEAQEKMDELPLKELLLSQSDINQKRQPTIHRTASKASLKEAVQLQPPSPIRKDEKDEKTIEDSEPKQVAKSTQSEEKIVQANQSETSNQTLYVTATAYTAYCDGCSGVTYTGIDLRANPDQKVIAVDPNIIPLGSKVWVEGYGTAIAGDIGGAIKGNRIDLFVPSHEEAMRYGVREVKVEIME